jgi:hypothetical protein
MYFTFVIYITEDVRMFGRNVWEFTVRANVDTIILYIFQ